MRSQGRESGAGSRESGLSTHPPLQSITFYYAHAARPIALMTLNRKLIFSSTSLILGLLILGAVALWGILGLRDNLQTVVTEFGELKMVAEVEAKVADAQRHLDPDLSELPRAVASLREAVAIIQTFIERRETQDPQVPYRTGEMTVAQRAARQLDSMADALEASMVQERPTLNLALAATLDDALVSLRALSEHADAAVALIAADTRRQIVRTISVMSVIAAGIIAAGIAIAIWQYRSVMNPLGKLRGAVRNIAAGQFTERVDPSGDREFAELAADFNRMATQLNDLYRDLERQVEVKSRELVRSERLASVGFLAAGIAHEINNPLGIISGYAELSLKDLDRGRTPDTEELRQSLAIMRDESFRCKQIIQKLLSLARQSADVRHDVDLSAVARDVAAMVRGLERYRDRRLVLDFPADQPLLVSANSTEMKQVLLNLTVNALEATGATGGREGRVSLSGRRDDGHVQIVVEDNGCGMSATTLSHIFEPFYTERRHDGVSGTGLGLSVTHAIIENHQGRITAESGGPGCGSRFIVHLPAAPPERAAPAPIAEKVA